MSLLKNLVFFFILVPACVSIECYAGMRLIAGTSVGDATIKCDNSAAYCYNMTATTHVILDVMKAGCSMWRCMFAQNKCISTTFQKIPISLCCCNTPFCNVAQGQIEGPQRTEGFNAEPQHHLTHLSKDEMERTLASGELDEDHEHTQTRAERIPTETTFGSGDQ